MHRLARETSLWLAPVVLMGVIFAFSAMPSDDVDHGFLYFLTRKAAHFTEYALLTALWWRALRTRLSPRAAVGLAVAISVVYAASDERHQRSVDGRVGTPKDVLIDAAGAATAAGLILRVRARRPDRVPG